jgi:RNA polymerase sigma factor (sigma-70 family)
MDVGVVALSEALDSLAELDPRGAEIVQMRFLAGMTNEQIADVLEVSVRTVERDWRAARAWLLDALAV